MASLSKKTSNSHDIVDKSDMQYDSELQLKAVEIMTPPPKKSPLKASQKTNISTSKIDTIRKSQELHHFHNASGSKVR